MYVCVYIIDGHNNVREVCIGKGIRMSIGVMMWPMELAYLDDLWLVKRQTPLNSWGLSCLSSAATVNFTKCYGPFQMFGFLPSIPSGRGMGTKDWPWQLELKMKGDYLSCSINKHIFFTL